MTEQTPQQEMQARLSLLRKNPKPGIFSLIGKEKEEPTQATKLMGTLRKRGKRGKGVPVRPQKRYQWKV